MLTTEKVLEQLGFAGSSHLVTRDSLTKTSRKQIEQGHQYSKILERSDGPDAVYEVNGVPRIYFKGLNQPSDTQVAAIHRFAWNRGEVPLLWVITPTELRVYSAYSRPTSEDNAQQHLIEMLSDISKGLDIYHREQFDTGAFWHGKQAREIRAQERVDRGLLNDIRGTTDKLTREGLRLNVAHALVGRTIFLAYLRDRELLPAELGGLVQNFGGRASVQHVLQWLRDTFNGDLFPLEPSDEGAIQDTYIQTLQRFLSGQDMYTGQQYFWPYRFDIIPIELISSIYEQFAHDADHAQAKAQSIHYTPPFLVRMMLSEAMKNLNSHARVLDPACGSGVFLVEAFKRLVHRRHMETGRNPEAEELRNILTTQVYGIELSEEAATITTFSLYLALLDMQEDLRQPIDFPHLLSRTIFSGDTFDEDARFNREPVFREKQFDLIVGNPPWTSWSSKGNKALGEKYCAARSLPIADRKPYQAFIWRIRDFASENTEICLLVHAMMLFLQGDRSVAFRQEFLRQHTLRAVINLSDLRKQKILPGVTPPAAILFFSVRSPEGSENMTYCCPKWSLDTRGTRQLILNADDITSFPISVAQRFEQIWKTVFWGTARDYELIRKLQSFSAFGAFLSHEGFDDEHLGRGYQEGHGSTMPELYGKAWLQSHQMRAYRLPLKLPSLPLLELHRAGKRGIYRAPLVVITRGLRDGRVVAAFSPHDLVYSSQYYGVAIPSDAKLYGYYLCAVLNSKVMTYFQFLTSSSWGIERDEIKKHDLLRTPVRPPSDVPGDLLKRVLFESQWLYENMDEARPAEISAHQSELDQLIYQLYGLTPTEQELVEDTLDLTVDFFQKRERSVSLRPPSEEHLREYADTVSRVLNAYLESIDKRYSVVVFDTRKSPLRMIKLTYDKAPMADSSIRVERVASLDEVQRELAPALQAEIAENLAVRRTLCIYQGTDIYILQSAERRLWSRSAARSEANRILQEHLGVM